MEQGEKVLFVASVERHLEHFHTPYMELLKSWGCEVHTAAGGENAIACVDEHFDLPFSRSPLGIRNISAYLRLRRLIGKNHYTLIHCHTPVAGFLTRLAARKARKNGAKVLYTAHGFHFYRGGNPVRNLIFLNAERFASRFTDGIVTINREDCEALERLHFHAGRSFRTHGVGIDETLYSPAGPEEKLAVRRSLGIPENAFVLIYPAEYIPRKNHRELLRAAALATEKCPELTLLLPGDGPERQNLMNLARTLGLAGKIPVSGFRTDVPQLLSCADLSVAPSLQEGLPTHVIEAMAAGLPCVASRARGHVDLVGDGENGLLYDAGSPNQLAEKIVFLYEHPDIRQTMGLCGLEKSKSYNLEETCREMSYVYAAFLERILI